MRYQIEPLINTRLGRLLAKTDNWQENKGGGIEEVK
jgi:hypothetical protein